MGRFPLDYEFWWRLLLYLCVFWAKNGFCNAKFVLSHIMRADAFPRFVARRFDEKNGHYKKSQRRYISPICGEFPTEPNSTKINIWVGVAVVINHTKFSNGVRVTEGRILACSIGIKWLVAYNTVARVCYM